MDTVQKVAVPLAIVIAGALIAAALYFANRGAAPIADPGNQPAAPSAEIAGVKADDHIRGNPNAELVIVEYSDTECPFCKQFHQTMKRVMDTYGADGRVAWVYRNFPLAQLHPKAPHEAEALECAAELGGNDAFWKYTDKIYEVTPSNNGLDIAQLPLIAQQVGLNKADFTTCLESGKHKARVDADMQEVIAAGGQGTPHSIVLYGGEQIVISGAQPFEVVKTTIDTLLAK